MDLLQMLSMCAMRSSLATEASRSGFASPEVGVLYQCSIASPMEYTFWRIMEWRYNKKSSCRLQQDALGSAKDNGRPINGLPILLHLFHQSLYLLTFDVFGLFHKKKNCGQMVGLPVTLLCCLKFNLAVSPQLENEVATLVHVCEFLKLRPGIFCVLNQWGIYEIAHLSALVDIKSLEALASIELSIDDMIFHNWRD